jgi:hypothetical protein
MTTTIPSTIPTTTSTTTSSTLEEIVRNNDTYRGRDLSEILGVTHVSGRYYFTSKDFMTEGADEIERLGIKTIKLWFNRTPNISYSYNSTWPTFVNNSTLGTVSNLPEYWNLMPEHQGKPMQSMVDMLKVSYYQDVLSPNRIFTTYVFEASEFKTVNWKNGMDPSEIASVEKEFYDVTVYLMQSQKGLKRTFLLQNWEGDNALNIQDFPSVEAQDVAIEGMAMWLNARQDGITRARNYVLGLDPSNDILVYGVAEVNHVNDPTASVPQFTFRTVTEAVLPLTRMDLYSFSTWGTRLPNDEKGLINKLNNIAHHAPDSAAFGNKNVMLGEFGAYQSTYEKSDNNYPQYLGNTAAAQYMANRKQIEFALQWGTQYILYWELYCNGFRTSGISCATPGTCVPHPDGSGQLVATNNVLAGVWLIDATGRLTPTWYYFNSLVAPSYIIDEMNDASLMKEYSTGLIFENSYNFSSLDNKFIVNPGNKIESVLYQLHATIEYASVKFFIDGQVNPNIAFFVSSDGVSFEEVSTSIRWSEYEEYGIYSGHVIFEGILAENVRFLRIDIPSSTRSLKIGGVAISGVSEELNPLFDQPYQVDYSGFDIQVKNDRYVLTVKPNTTSRTLRIHFDDLNNFRFRFFGSTNTIDPVELLGSLQAYVEYQDKTIKTIALLVKDLGVDSTGKHIYQVYHEEALGANVKYLNLEVDGYSSNWLYLDSYSVENIYTRPLEIRGISQDEIYEELNSAIHWFRPLSRDTKFGIGNSIIGFTVLKPILFLHADASYTFSKTVLSTEVQIRIHHQSVTKLIKFTDR